MSTRFYKREECRCSNDGMKPEEEKKAGDGFGNDREVQVGGRCDREKQLCRLWFKMLSLELRGQAQGPVPHACLSVSEHMRNQSAIWYTRQENRDRFCGRAGLLNTSFSVCDKTGAEAKEIHLAFIWLSVLRLKRERTRDGKRREREHRWKWGGNKPVMARERIPVSSGDLWRKNSRFARLPSFPLHSCHFFHREACQNMMKDWREWLWHDIRHRQLETHFAVTRTHCLLG